MDLEKVGPPFFGCDESQSATRSKAITVRLRFHHERSNSMLSRELTYWYLNSLIVSGITVARLLILRGKTEKMMPLI